MNAAFFDVLIKEDQYSLFQELRHFILDHKIENKKEHTQVDIKGCFDDAPLSQWGKLTQVRGRDQLSKTDRQ